MGVGGSSLADQLYEAVSEQLDKKSQHLAGKITGMLLEAEEDCITEMLKSDSVLQAAIERTKVSLESHEGLGHNKAEMGVLDTFSEDELGDLLYEKIVTEYPEQASKLTGMLLEMDKSSLTKVLQSEDLLRIALERALTVIRNKQNFDVTPQHRNENSIDNDPFGDQLYEKVQSIYPDDAPKITGMLLELDKDIIEKILQDDNTFQEAVQKAAEVLTNSMQDPY